MPVTDSQVIILWRWFERERCPVCQAAKLRRNCFCPSCYFAIKCSRPDLAAGLWTNALEENSNFFESYLGCKQWLSKTGLHKREKGGLIA